MSETNTTVPVEKSHEEDSAVIQLLTSLVSILCVIISLAAYSLNRRWRKHNYLYAKQVIITCLASCWMFIIIIFTEDIEDPEDDFTINDMLTTAYFALVIMAVSGTVHIVALGHIYVALSCDEIADEDTFVALSWYYFTAITVFVLFNVQSILRIDLQTALSIAGVQVSAITTGNVMLLSRTYNGIEKKCSFKIPFMFFVISLGILLDVLLILYGALLLAGSRTGPLNDLLKMTCTAAILLKTVLILCCRNVMDWKNCRSRSDEEIEM